MLENHFLLLKKFKNTESAHHLTPNVEDARSQPINSTEGVGRAFGGCGS